MKRTRPPDLTIVLDFGGSATKGVYSGADLQNEKILCMEPEVISLTLSGIAHYEQSKLGKALPADSAWVKVDEACYAVGYLARSQFNGNPGLSSLKYERAFPKTLAAVWVAAQELKLKNKFSAALAVLLPAGEYESGSQLQELLTEGLKNFETPSGKMSVTLTRFQCKPEGGGIYLIHRHHSGVAAQRQTVAIVMVGYRNASVLLSERGRVSEKVTSDLGFIKLVKLVEARISSLPSTEKLAIAIALAGDQAQARHFLPLAMSNDPLAREDESERILTAVQDCKRQYAFMLLGWLREVLPRQANLDEVVLCGGTAEYLKQELEDHFSQTSLTWNGGIKLSEHIDDQGLGCRIFDAYGMYLCFRGLVSTETVAVAATTG